MDISQLIRPGCSLEEDQFVIAGRGGLTSSPFNLLESDVVWVDLRPFGLSDRQLIDLTPIKQPAGPELMQEATEMAIAPNGSLQLIATNTQNMTNLHASCRGN